MTNRSTNPLAVEHRAHLLLLGAVGAVLLIAATVTKNERAVFLTEGTGLPAKAFAAMVPSGRSLSNNVDPVLAQRSFSRSDLSELTSGRRPSTPPLPANTLAPNPSFAIPAQPQVTLGAPAAESVLANPNPVELASLSPTRFAPIIPQPSAGGGGIPNSGGGGTTDPTNPVDTTPPVTTPTPTPTPTPTASTTPTPPITTPTSPATPVAPPVTTVPEPGTWTMLLLGFFAIGVAGRRRVVTSQVRTA